MKKVFKLIDLDCANCARKMEEAIRRIDGVEEVQISFLTQKMTLTADDARFDAIVDEEISIGDYVVTGGEIPACIVIDAVSRLKEGVLAAKECYEGESVASGILEYPQYTKPRVYNGMEVPEVLLSGDHKDDSNSDTGESFMSNVLSYLH